MIKICYVILHYLTDEDTSQCIDSIKDNSSNNYKIIVVDNYSNNGSLEKLEEKYSQNPDIHFIESKSNLGFAKGNNLGINYARDNFDPDFIVVLNNDTLILDSTLEEKLDRRFKQSNFSVLGPCILTADGKTDSNPYRTIPLATKKDLKKRIKELNRKIVLLQLGLGPIIKKIRKLQKRGDLPKTAKTQINPPSMNVEYNVMLHGSCLIFSRTFFEHLKGFYPGTFLFLEEDILYYQLQKNHLISVYDPSIKIYHKEDSATTQAWKNKDMSLEKFKYLRQSTKAFLKLMNKE